jgi:serine/threonine-protein kinase
MATAPSNGDPNLVGQVVAEWRERLHKGEHFEVGEYTAKYPAIADELRELFPALVMIEDLKGDAGGLTGSVGAGAILAEGKTLQRLGDFRIVREVGRGGMGIVYEAEQESLGRQVALKVLPAQALLDPQKQKRFQREAKAAARMHHTNIVPVYGVGEHDGLYYYVMQFIRGLGLDEVLRELKRLHAARRGSNHVAAACAALAPAKNFSAADVALSLLTGHFAATAAADEGQLEACAQPATLTAGPGKGEGSDQASPAEPPGAQEPTHAASQPPRKATVSSSSTGLSSSDVLSATGDKSSLTESGRHYWQSVARIGIQVAEALDYAHAQGILHRDIKPSNLLLDTQGTLWVTDFGLAKVSAEGDNLTHTGDIVGTLRYMAPERFNGISDTRGDIYSLGLTLYEMVTERAAFGESDRSKLIKQVTGTSPPSPRKINPMIPRDLETIVLKATDREPSRRYQTARALADDLKRFVDDKPIHARQASSAERLWRWCRRNPAVASLSAAILTLLVGLAVGSTIVALRFENMAKEEARLRTQESELRLLADEARDKAETARQEAENNLQEARRQKQLADSNFRKARKLRLLADQARDKAVTARREAESNLQEAQRQKQLADTNFRKARMAVDDSLTRISESRLLHVPGLQPLRKELLESALKYYQGFLDQRSDDLAVQKDLATAYTRVAKITAEISSPDKALEAYRQALAMRQKLLKRMPRDLETQAEIAYHHQAVGRLQRKLGQPDAALKSLQEASAGLRAVIPQVEEKSGLLSGFASVYNDIGGLYVHKNEPLEAMSYFTAALKLQRQLVDENPKHAKIVQLKYELANQLNQMGRLHFDIGLFRDALKLHGQALQILNGLVAAHPRHELSNDLQRALASSYEYVGDAENPDKQADGALTSYHDALAIRERLANANPAVTEYQNDLAHSYFTLGQLQAERGQSAEAAQAYQRAIERQRLVIAVAPEGAEYLRLLGRQLARLGRAQRELGQPAAALRAYQEARAILEKLAPPTADDLYELACARAACGVLAAHGKKELTPKEQEQRARDGKAAVAALSKAVATGFRDVDRVRKDPELEDLRSQSALKAVLNDLQAKVKVLAWNRDFETAKAQASQQKKDLFVYFTGSDWCSWCLLVSKNVFGKDAFIEYAPRHFVLVELDFPHYKGRPKNYVANQELVQRWGLKGFPSLILADAQGRPYADVRDGKVRDTAAAYIARIEKLRKVRVARDELLAQALTREGLEKARCLDKALDLLPADFRGEYPEIVKQIWELDAQDQAGLRAKYLPVLVRKPRNAAQELMRKQDWDGTILKIDKIIAELKPTGKVAADIYVDRARACVKLRQWEKADADYSRALELKPDDADLRIERAGFYEQRGQADKAKADFDAAVGLKAKTVDRCRTAFTAAPHATAKRRALSAAYLALAKVQRKVGRPAAAAATARERAKLWPGSFLETYVLAGELAQCAPLVGKDKKLTDELRAQRQKYADEAMEALRAAVLLGWDNAAQTKIDVNLDSLRNRDDYRQLIRQLEQPSTFAAANESRRLGGVNAVECVAIAPDGRRVLFSGYDDTVRLWDLATGQEVRRFVGHKGLVHGLAFLPDGSRVVTGGRDGTVRLWDVETGKEVRQFPEHEGAVLGLALSPDGKRLLTGGQDKTLRLCDVATGKMIRQLKGHTGLVLSVAFAADGRHALSGGAEPTVYYWDVETGKVVHRLKIPEDLALRVALSQDSRLALAGTMGGFVYVWDLKSGRQRYRMDGHWAPVRAVGFTPDGRRTISANIQRGLVVADAETGRALHRLGTTLAFGGLAVNSDGRWLATANIGSVHLWTLLEDVLAARDLAGAGHLDKADAAYAQAVKQHPDDLDLRIERARFHARIQQWGKAIAALTQVLEKRKTDPEPWLDRAKVYAGAGQNEKAAADFAQALALVRDDAPSSPEPTKKSSQRPAVSPQRTRILDEIVRSDDLVARVARLRPKDSQLWLASSHYQAARRQWAKVATALAKVVELDPTDHLNWYWLAPTYLELGNKEGYRRVCREMLDRFGKSDGPDIAMRIAMTCSLAPDAGVDRAQVLKLADSALAADGHPLLKWFHLVRGMADYRQGEFAKAVDRLRLSLSPGAEVAYRDGIAYLFLAMAQQKLGRIEEARESMAKARVVAEEKFPKVDRGQLLGSSWSDWVRFQVIRREAEELVKPPAPVSQK